MAAEFVLLLTSRTLALLVQGFHWRTFSPVSAARYVSSVPCPVRACGPVATPQDDFGLGLFMFGIVCFVEHRDGSVPM